MLLYATKNDMLPDAEEWNGYRLDERLIVRLVVVEAVVTLVAVEAV